VMHSLHSTHMPTLFLSLQQKSTTVHQSHFCKAGSILRRFLFVVLKDAPRLNRSFSRRFAIELKQSV
jgi:hypothetical protein